MTATWKIERRVAAAQRRVPVNDAEREQRETEALDAAIAEWEQRIADRRRAEAEIVARRRDIRLGGKW